MERERERREEREKEEKEKERVRLKIFRIFSGQNWNWKIKKKLMEWIDFFSPSFFFLFLFLLLFYKSHWDLAILKLELFSRSWLKEMLKPKPGKPTIIEDEDQQFDDWMESESTANESNWKKKKKEGKGEEKKKSTFHQFLLDFQFPSCA